MTDFVAIVKASIQEKSKENRLFLTLNEQNIVSVSA